MKSLQKTRKDELIQMIEEYQRNANVVHARNLALTEEIEHLRIQLADLEKKKGKVVRCDREHVTVDIQDIPEPRQATKNSNVLRIQSILFTVHKNSMPVATVEAAVFKSVSKGTVWVSNQPRSKVYPIALSLSETKSKPSSEPLGTVKPDGVKTWTY